MGHKKKLPKTHMVYKLVVVISESHFLLNILQRVTFHLKNRHPPKSDFLDNFFRHEYAQPKKFQFFCFSHELGTKVSMSYICIDTQLLFCN